MARSLFGAPSRAAQSHCGGEQGGPGGLAANWPDSVHSPSPGTPSHPPPYHRRLSKRRLPVIAGSDVGVITAFSIIQPPFLRPPHAKVVAAPHGSLFVPPFADTMSQRAATIFGPSTQSLPRSNRTFPTASPLSYKARCPTCSSVAALHGPLSNVAAEWTQTIGQGADRESKAPAAFLPPPICQGARRLTQAAVGGHRHSQVNKHIKKYI